MPKSSTDIQKCRYVGCSKEFKSFGWMLRHMIKTHDYQYIKGNLVPNSIQKFRMIPIEHGDEDTHYACKEQIDKYGDQTSCCGCRKHECKPIDIPNPKLKSNYQRPCRSWGVPIRKEKQNEKR